MEPIIPFVGIALLFGLYFWFIYNHLVTLRLRVGEAWSQIDVQLKRRTDLVPNLVEIVKGYAKHEKTVFNEVTKARSALLAAKTPADKDSANNMLVSALKSVFAVAEAYPQLRASENFKTLQEEVTDTEDKVAYSRQFYNTVVMEYNTALTVFPNVLFAGTLGFQHREFFGRDLTPGDKEAVKVSFES